jgi:hypothetical protein
VRYGTEKLELLVNKIILDKACAARGVTATPAEVEAELAKECKRFNVDRANLAEKILKPQRLTLFEWTEDVLKPKILLGKLSRGRVKVTDDDLKKAFEAYYGEKVRCRIILWPKGEEKMAMLDYARLRDDERAFNQKARTQASPTLAAKGGEVPPFGRNSTGNEELEKEVFELQPGEVSRLIGTPEGTVIVKCDAREPAAAAKTLQDVREQLTLDIVERKTQLEMPKVFAELRRDAKPRFMLKDPNKVEDITADVGAELKELNLKPIAHIDPRKE